MCTELKNLINVVIKMIIVITVILALAMAIFGHAVLGFIFFLGLLVATINFILSGILFEKFMNSKKKIINYIFQISHILRIISIIIIAYPFIYNIKQLLSYIFGFTSFIVILIISWMKMQRSVRKWSHTKQ